MYRSIPQPTVTVPHQKLFCCWSSKRRTGDHQGLTAGSLIVFCLINLNIFFLLAKLATIGLVGRCHVDPRARNLS